MWPRPRGTYEAEKIINFDIFGEVFPFYFSFKPTITIDGHCGRDYDPPMPIEPERETLVKLFGGDLVLVCASGPLQGWDFDPPEA